MCQYDLIRKTGSTQVIAATPEEDETTAVGNIHKEW